MSEGYSAIQTGEGCLQCTDEKENFTHILGRDRGQIHIQGADDKLGPRL